MIYQLIKNANQQGQSLHVLSQKYSQHHWSFTLVYNKVVVYLIIDTFVIDNVCAVINLIFLKNKF